MRAANRDKQQILKNHAEQGKLDVLLFCLLERIGRTAGETSLGVEWIMGNGIRGESELPQAWIVSLLLEAEKR